MDLETQVLTDIVNSQSMGCFRQETMLQHSTSLYDAVGSATPPASPPLECGTSESVSQVEVTASDHEENDHPEHISNVDNIGLHSTAGPIIDKVETVENMADDFGKEYSKSMKVLGRNVMEYLVETKCPVDTVICCHDGRVGAHRMVLTAASSFLGKLLKDQKDGEVAVLILPDIRRQVMEALLQLAYTGRMIYPPEMEEEILSAVECLFFACSADLDLTMVNVMKREPPPPVVPLIQNKTLSTGSGSSHDRRKREADERCNDGKGPVKKKLRIEGKTQKYTNQVKSRKEQWLKTVKNPATKRNPEYLLSDPTSNHVKLNPLKLPLVSLQITRIRGNIIVEAPSGHKRWFDTEAEREQYYRLSRGIESDDSSQDSESESIRDSRNDDSSDRSPSKIEDNRDLDFCNTRGLSRSVSPDVYTEANVEVTFSEPELDKSRNLYADLDTQVVMTLEDFSEHRSSDSQSEMGTCIANINSYESEGEA